MWRTRQSSGGQRYSEPMAQVYGSPRVYVPDGTDARDDGEKCAQVYGSPREYVPDGTDARDDGEKCAQVYGSVAAPVPAAPA